MPGRPGQVAVGRPPNPMRPKMEISVGGWSAGLSGTVSNHPGVFGDESDLEQDLGIDRASGISLDFALQFPRGPRFRLGIRTLGGDGEMPDVTAATLFPPPSSGIVHTDLSLFMLDLAFCPMARQARWGSLSLETGLRYASADLSVGDEEDGLEEGFDGFMLTLGGDLAFPVYKEQVSMDVGADVGLGGDAAFFEFNLGLKWHPTKQFWARLGYRLVAMALIDRMEEADERDLSFSAGGPGLELGLKF
jgi:hypothetical protein